MPLQNRVLATGDIIADPARGMFMGNRGILHGDQKVLGQRRWTHKAWVTCVLEHKDWHRKIMMPHRYTELFFLDEAVALAAGHRPCALCRRTDYTAYRRAADLSGPSKEMDAKMHAERAVTRSYSQRRHEAEIAQLPDGAIILQDTPMLVLRDALQAISPKGYARPVRRQHAGTVTVLTPPTSLDALRSGYRPRLHTSADA